MKKRMFVISTLAVVSCAGLAWAGHVRSSRFFVPSPSMEPPLPFQSIIAVEKNFYSSPAQVKRGDIILYSQPQTPQDAFFVKRVVALPGDRVCLSGTSVWVNGQPLFHALQSRSTQALVFRETDGSASYTVEYQPNPASFVHRAVTTTVPSDRFFVLGDNRDNSYDSRYLGSIPFGAIVGKAKL